MLKWIKTVVLAMMLATTGLSAIPYNYSSIINDRVYIRSEDVDSTDEAFMVHVGENMWFETNILYRDTTGMYTYKSVMESKEAAYEKKWRCPYCNRYYSIGQRCSNPDCPSKY